MANTMTDESGSRIGAVPYRCHDDSRLFHDRGNFVVLVRIHRRQELGHQDRYHLQAVLGAVVDSIAL